MNQTTSHVRDSEKDSLSLSSLFLLLEETVDSEDEQECADCDQGRILAQGRSQHAPFRPFPPRFRLATAPLALVDRLDRLGGKIGPRVPSCRHADEQGGQREAENRHEGEDDADDEQERRGRGC